MHVKIDSSKEGKNYCGQAKFTSRDSLIRDF